MLDQVLNEGVVQADAEVKAAVQAYRSAKAEAEAAERLAKEARERLLDVFDAHGAAEFMAGERVLVKRSKVVRETLDKEVVRKMAPATFDKARRVSESYRVTLGK